MLIRDGRNLFGTFRVKTTPVYVPESRNGRPYCKFIASTRAAVDEESTDDLPYEVMVIGDPAIPASKTILPGALLIVGGRSLAGQYFRKDKVTLFADFWFPVVQDPYHYVDILKAQMAVLADTHLGNLYRAAGIEEENADSND